jgi:hypothetical protein
MQESPEDDRERVKIDREKIENKFRFDGKWLLVTNTTIQQSKQQSNTKYPDRQNRLFGMFVLPSLQANILHAHMLTTYLKARFLFPLNFKL